MIFLIGTEEFIQGDPRLSFCFGKKKTGYKFSDNYKTLPFKANTQE